MGNEESGPGLENEEFDDQAAYVRMNGDREGDDFMIHETEPQHKIGDFGFAAVWSQITPKSVSPAARGGHFTVFSKEMNKIFIGYGANSNQELFNDIWSLDLSTHTWQPLALNGDQVSPRTGTRAILVGTNLILFGGFRKPEYLEDLHYINLLTGTVRMVETTGEKPGPRSTPMLAYNNGKLFVWGGFNQQYPTTLHILDMHSLVWRSCDPGISGRTGIPVAQIGDIAYGYGGSKSGGFVTIDTNSETVNILRPAGEAPPSELVNAGLVPVDNYLFFFGGKLQDKKYSRVYQYDSERNFWYAVPVVPDGETATMYDGKVDKNGIFKLPKRYNFSFAYDASNRRLIACLGYPHESIMSICSLSICDALSVIHLRSDMLNMLK